MVAEHSAGRQRTLRIMLVVMATILILLLFVACERLGVVNIISGSPEEVAKTFLQDLSEGEADFGWHLLKSWSEVKADYGWHLPEVVNDVSKEEYIKAVQTLNVTPFKFEVLRALRDEVYLAQIYVRIEFTHPIEQWPAGLDHIFKGKFTNEDGRSFFRGYFLLRKEGFRWRILPCCG